MLASRCASDVSNWLKNAPYRAPELATPCNNGLSPRFAPVLEICRRVRVATRTCGTDRLSDNRSLCPSSAVMGVLSLYVRTPFIVWRDVAVELGTPTADTTTSSNK